MIAKKEKNDKHNFSTGTFKACDELTCGFDDFEPGLAEL